MKVIKLKESQLKKIVSNVIKENESYGGNYMFFSNLEQMKRQCELLLQLDKDKVNQLLEQGHDWADDHISSAKENIDQVFDFMMNETKEHEGDQQSVSADMDQFSLNEEGQLDEKCWDGYKQVGSKNKNGKMVPNCVPVSEASSPAQQAAIAINMKKLGKKPKNESEKEMYEAMEIDESKNCPTDPAKWSASKAAAKSKFDVYPSAYANGWAAKNYKAKGGGWRKCK
jgi:hypothetical protein